MCEINSKNLGLFFGTRIFWSNTEKVLNHFKIIKFLFSWIDYINQSVKSIKVDVDFSFDKNLLEFIKRNLAILIMVNIIKQILNIVNLK